MVTDSFQGLKSYFIYDVDTVTTQMDLIGAQ